MRAIIVDDETPSIERLASLIEEDNRLEITNTFTDAEAALSFCKSNHVDILFSDIEMPCLNGLDFGRAVKEYNSASNIQNSVDK